METASFMAAAPPAKGRAGAMNWNNLNVKSIAGPAKRATAGVRSRIAPKKRREQREKSPAHALKCAASRSGFTISAESMQ